MPADQSPQWTSPQSARLITSGYLSLAAGVARSEIGPVTDRKTNRWTSSLLKGPFMGRGHAGPHYSSPPSTTYMSLHQFPLSSHLVRCDWQPVKQWTAIFAVILLELESYCLSQVDHRIILSCVSKCCRATPVQFLTSVDHLLFLLWTTQHHDYVLVCNAAQILAGLSYCVQSASHIVAICL